MDKFDELMELCEKILPDVYSAILWALTWNTANEDELLEHMKRKLAEITL